MATKASPGGSELLGECDSCAVTTAAAAATDLCPDTCVSVISLWDGKWGGGKSFHSNSLTSTDKSLRRDSPPADKEMPTNSQSQAVPISAAVSEDCLNAAAADASSSEPASLLQLNAELEAEPTDVQTQAPQLLSTLHHQLQLHAELTSEMSGAHSQLSMHELELQSAMIHSAELATDTAHLVSDNTQLASELADAQSRGARLLSSQKQHIQCASACEDLLVSELVGAKSRKELLSGHELQLQKALALNAQLASELSDAQSREARLLSSYEQQIQCASACEEGLVSELAGAKSQLEVLSGQELQLQKAMALNAQLASDLADGQSREARLLSSHEQQIQCASVRENELASELVGAKSQLELLSGHELQRQKAVALNAQLASELSDAQSSEARLLSSHEQQIQCVSVCEKELASELAGVMSQLELLSGHDIQLQKVMALNAQLVSDLTEAKPCEARLLFSHEKQTQCASARENQLASDLVGAKSQLDLLSGHELQLQKAMALNAQLASDLADGQSPEAMLLSSYEQQVQCASVCEDELASELADVKSQLETLSGHELQLQKAVALNGQLALDLADTQSREARLLSSNEQLRQCASACKDELADVKSREEELPSSHEHQLQYAAAQEQVLRRELTSELVGAKSQLELLSGYELQLQKALALNAQLVSELSDAQSREVRLLSSHEQQIQCAPACKDELASELADVKSREARLLSSHEHQLQCAAARDEALSRELAASKMMMLAALHLAEKVVDGHSSCHALEPVHGAVGATGGASADASTYANGGIPAAVPDVAATAPGSVTTIAFAAGPAPADAVAVQAPNKAVSAAYDGATQAPAEAAASVGVSVMQQLASDAVTGFEHQISDLTRELEQARLSLQACYERMGGISVNLASKEHELKHAQPLFEQQPGDASAWGKNSGESVQQLLAVCGQLSSLSANLAAKDVHLVHIQQLLLASVAQISDRNASLAAMTDELSSIQNLAASEKKAHEASAHSAALEAELGRLQQQPYVSVDDRCSELSASLPVSVAVDAGKMASVQDRLEASGLEFYSAVAHWLSLEGEATRLQALLDASAQQANSSLACEEPEVAAMRPTPFLNQTTPSNSSSELQSLEGGLLDSLLPTFVRAMVSASVDKQLLKAEYEEKLTRGLAALKAEDSRLSFACSSHGFESTPGSLFGGMWPTDVESMMQQIVQEALAAEHYSIWHEESEVFERGLDDEGHPLEQTLSRTPSEKSVGWHEVSGAFRRYPEYADAAVQVVPSDFDIEFPFCATYTRRASNPQLWTAMSPATDGTFRARRPTSGSSPQVSLLLRGPSNLKSRLSRGADLLSRDSFGVQSSMEAAPRVYGGQQEVQGHEEFSPTLRYTLSPGSACSSERGFDDFDVESPFASPAPCDASTRRVSNPQLCATMSPALDGTFRARRSTSGGSPQVSLLHRAPSYLKSWHSRGADLRTLDFFATRGSMLAAARVNGGKQEGKGRQVFAPFTRSTSSLNSVGSVESGYSTKSEEPARSHGRVDSGGLEKGQRAKPKQGFSRRSPKASPVGRDSEPTTPALHAPTHPAHSDSGLTTPTLHARTQPAHGDSGPTTPTLHARTQPAHTWKY